MPPAANTNPVGQTLCKGKSVKDKIRGGVSALTFLEIVEEPVMKIIGLVQDNQWFFGNPGLGDECMKIAADKLEELIKSAQQSFAADGRVCTCNSPSSYEMVDGWYCGNCGMPARR